MRVENYTVIYCVEYSHKLRGTLNIEYVVAKERVIKPQVN